MSADHMIWTTCVPTARVATRWEPGAWVTSGSARWAAWWPLMGLASRRTEHLWL